MIFLNDDEREQIHQAITRVERQTEGELVAVIAETSDGYRYIPTLWAAILALAAPLLFLGYQPTPWHLLYSLQLLAFIALLLLFQATPLKMRLIPRSVKLQRASRLAFEQFYRRGIHRTRNRSGLLIFVSVAEHYVEIIADQGIHQRVPDNHWQAIVDDFIAAVRRGDTAAGFLRCIDACGSQLAEHFPPEGEPADQLSNHLFEIPGPD